MDPIVIARAPGYLTFGAVDAPRAPTEKQERLTITAAVDYYAYAIVSPSRSPEVRISIAEENGCAWREPNRRSVLYEESGLPDTIMRLFGAREGLSIFLSAQAPLGAGLGLLGSLTVAMIKALAFFHGLDLEPSEVAALACQVRRDVLNLEDRDECQYAAACGGLIGITSTGDAVQSIPLRVTPEIQQTLDRHLMLFGVLQATLDHRGIYTQQLDTNMVTPSDEPKSRVPHNMSRKVRASLEQGNCARLGALLQHAWLEQCRASSVDQDNILIEALHAARDNGALGGQATRIGSGLLVVLCPEVHQPGVTSALTARGLRQLPVSLESEGVQVMEAVPHTRLTSISSWQDQLRLGSKLRRMA